MTEEEIQKSIRNAGVPKIHEALYRRALTGDSRASSIKAMCLECQGWTDGAMRAVRDCPTVRCPLHAVRPYRTGEEAPDADA